jgi:molecular chaperone GrpE
MCDDKEKKVQEEAIPEEENQRKTEEQTATLPEEGAGENKAPAEEKKLTPEEELAALQEKYIYLQAEYQNYRKRMVKEIADARRYALEDTVQPFFAVYDFLAMAETAAAQSDNVEAIRQGLMMIIAQYKKAFEELNLKPFDAKGEKFDPELHDAVAHESSADVEEGVVSKQWNCGFKLGDKVLRPARVVVSSGAPAEEDKKEE